MKAQIKALRRKLHDTTAKLAADRDALRSIRDEVEELEAHADEALNALQEADEALSALL